MKYTTEQLKTMSQRVLQAKEEGDVRYLQFCMQVALKVGVAPNVVMAFVDKMGKL